MEIGLKRRSEPRCLSTKEHDVQDKRSSKRESFITGSWCQSSGRRYLDPQATPTSITNLTNFIGNQSKQPRELGFMANSSSEAFIEAHRDLQDSPGCHLPRIIVGLMFASDGTHLTAFSNAKLWPLYLAIGNESKYRRSKPS